MPTTSIRRTAILTLCCVVAASCGGATRPADGRSATAAVDPVPATPGAPPGDTASSSVVVDGDAAVTLYSRSQQRPTAVTVHVGESIVVVDEVDPDHVRPDGTPVLAGGPTAVVTDPGGPLVSDLLRLDAEQPACAPPTTCRRWIAVAEGTAFVAPQMTAGIMCDRTGGTPCFGVAAAIPQPTEVRIVAGRPSVSLAVPANDAELRVAAAAEGIVTVGLPLVGFELGPGAVGVSTPWTVSVAPDPAVLAPIGDPQPTACRSGSCLAWSVRGAAGSSTTMTIVSNPTCVSPCDADGPTPIVVEVAIDVS